MLEKECNEYAPYVGTEDAKLGPMTIWLTYFIIQTRGKINDTKEIQV